MGARYYDPTVGTFLTRDTDLSQSPYAYCDGDPVNCTDPSGHLSAVNIASGGIAISGLEDGSENAPVDTSGDNKPTGGSGTIKTGSGDVTVASSGKSVTGTYSSGDEAVSVTVTGGNIAGVGERGTIPLGGVLAGLGATFSGNYNFTTGQGNSRAGLSYSHNGFIGGFSTNGRDLMANGGYKATF